MDAQKNAVIFADAYGGLRYLLCLIEEQVRKGSKVTVVVIAHPLYGKLLNYLNATHFGGTLTILDVEGYKDNSKSRLERFLRSFVAETLYLRNIYQSSFSNISGCEVYFTVRKHLNYIFYWVKQLSRNNTVYLLDADPTTNEIVSRPSNFTEWLIYFRWRVIYDWQIEFKRGVGVVDEIFGQIGREYLRKYRVTVLDSNAYSHQANGILSRYALRESGIKVLLIDQDISESGMLNIRDFEEALNRVNDVLTKYFQNSEIGVKRHPFFPLNHRFSVENKVELDAWIPAELYMSESVKFVISFHSNALKIASNEVCAISLIDLLPFRPEYTEEYKHYLMNNSDKEIVFPKNIDEFERLVSQYADN
jgi:hypothetical protein